MAFWVQTLLCNSGQLLSSKKVDNCMFRKWKGQQNGQRVNDMYSECRGKGGEEVP